MTRTLISLLLLCCWLLQAGTTTVVVGQPVGGAAPSYLFRETFDTNPGYDNGAWSEILGTPDEDYTTSPAPLEGTESLQISGAERITCYNAWTPISSDWTYGFFEIYGAGSTDYIVLDLYDSTPSLIGYFQFRPTGQVRCYHGSSYVQFAGPSRDRHMYVWFHWYPGTGSNGELLVYFSETTTKPSTPDVTVSNGTSTTGPAGFRYYYNGTTDDCILDNMTIDDVVITGVP